MHLGIETISVTFWIGASHVPLAITDVISFLRKTFFVPFECFQSNIALGIKYLHWQVYYPHLFQFGLLNKWSPLLHKYALDTLDLINIRMNLYITDRRCIPLLVFTGLFMELIWVKILQLSL